MTTELDLGWFDPSLGALQRPEAAGVSTGLSRAIAERLGVDVVLVRVVFIVLAFCAGLGLALYGWGTVLTRGPQGTRPIDQVLPGFRDWSPLMQKAAVVISTIIVVATLDAALPLPWGAGVLVLIALVLVRRRARNSGAFPPAHHPLPSGTPAVAPLDDQTLVEHWRRGINEAVGSHRAAVPSRQLPTVDLYAPEEPPAPRMLVPQAKNGWWMGVAVIVAMMAASFVSAGLLGYDLSTTLAATTATGGVVTVICALAARDRRIPRVVLAALAASIVATGWLATQTAVGPAPAPTDDTDVVRLVGREGVVDLSGMQLDDQTVLRVEVIASDVELILPGPVEEMTTTLWLADVTVAPGSAADAGTATGGLHIDVHAQLSDVLIKESA
ncbi:PspC domain-containing protein [Tessaracoccus sp. MC1865]|uniref:PspC domain-containing protein n=1 Tax=Tessaracoccus sp. MC1865 TaxID=2760310 RepID=UPI00160157BC|nr:PspC domain-containing protein [Tessaracoccus sp. MC1865]MBB1484600.1 PspC domain-containing protein [Tessaracoccus sp. MC1865]QTO38312.1 PspC domain-containing protein [Tessaracoccus sp. MC1865]